MTHLHNSFLISLLLFTSTCAQQATCIENNARCTGSNTYQVCTGGVYGANQTCLTGLVCSPSGNNAFCVRPSEVTTASSTGTSSGSMMTTGAACPENNARCTGNNTYQVCTGGVYGANQTCFTGLVCSPSGNNAFCVRPSEVTTGASTGAGSTTMTRMTTGTAASTSGTTGNNNLTGTSCSPNGSQRCVSNNSYVTCTNGQYSVSQFCLQNLTCTPSGNNIYCQTAPTSSGSASSSSGTTMRPSTSGVNPVTSGMGGMTSTTGSSTCSPNGSQRCLSNNTYTTCTNGFFSQSQSCPSGLTCSPSGNNIYCIRQVVPGQACSVNGYQSCVTSETYSTCTNGVGSTAQMCNIGTTCRPSGNNIYCN